MGDLGQEARYRRGRAAPRRAAARIAALSSIVAVVTATAATAATYDPAYEARNYAKINERAASDYTPQFNAQLAAQGAANETQGAQILATDGPAAPYGRDPTGNVCFHHMNGCAGDVRLYGWSKFHNALVYPVLFTQRNGSTLSGHVWMTRSGPVRRPGVVITNGSIQAPEQLYWYAAETLAEDGYVVLTWDPQGQGYSDTYGDGVDRNDGVPSQAGQPSSRAPRTRWPSASRRRASRTFRGRAARLEPRTTTSRSPGSRPDMPRPTTHCRHTSTPRTLASPAIRSAPRPSPTSASSTHA